MHLTTAHGAPAIAALRRVVLEAKAGDALAPVVVLVQDNITALTVRRSLASGLGEGSRGVAAVECLTITQFAERLAAPVLAEQQRRPATSGIIAARVRRELAANTGAFGEVALHPATVAAVARASRRLRPLSEPALAAVASHGSTLTTATVDLHRRLWHDLEDAWYDDEQILQVATTRLAHVDLPACVLHLPGRLTWRRAAFLEALAGRTDLSSVIGVVGVPKVDASLFTSLPATVRGVLQPSEVVAPLADEVVHATDPDEEVRHVVRRVVGELERHPARRIAVLYSQRQPYARVLHEQFAAAGIEVNGPGSRPVAERSYARLVLGLLEAAREDWPRRATMRALTAVPVRTISGEPGNLNRWDRLTREIGVSGGDDWDRRLAEHIEAQTVVRDDAEAPDWRREAATRQIADAEALRDLVTSLRTRLADLTSRDTWLATATELRALLDELVDTDALRRRSLGAADELHALAAVNGAVAGLATLDQAEVAPSLETLHDSLAETLERSNSRVGRFGEGVHVGGIEQASGLDLDVVFLCGLSEDQYPGTLNEDALIADSARAASAGELETIAERAAHLHRSLLMAMQTAPHVVACFSRGDLRANANRVPSRFLLDSIRALSGNPAAVASKFMDLPGLTHVASFADALRTADFPAQEQEWRVQALMAGLDLDDEVVAAAEVLNLARRSPEPTRFDGLIGPDPARSPFRDGYLASPTSLERYAACPHAYFLERVLGVQRLGEPEEILQLARDEIGNFVHYSLDQLVTEATEAGQLPRHGQPWTPEQRQRLQQIGEGMAVDFERRGVTGHPRLWARQRRELLTLLDDMLTHDDEVRAAAAVDGHSVVGSEVRFGFDDVPPVEIDVDGRTLRLRGSADLVLEHDADPKHDGRHHLTVIDIKTGKGSKYREVKQQEPFVHGTALQLPAYARAARTLHGRDDTVVTAEYWLPQVGKTISLVVDDQIDEAYDDVLGVIARSIEAGIFTANPPLEDDYVGVKCAFCNPDGSGYAARRERWQTIRSAPELRELLRLIDPKTAQALDDEDDEATEETGEWTT